MKLDWRGALGIGLSIALMWWTLKGENLAEIWSLLRASNLALFLFATFVCTLIFPLRALRWRTILEPVAGRIAYGPLWRATSIGMMVNNLVPARAGEIARVYALTRELPRLSFATVLASLAVDRMFDGLILLILTFAPLLDPAFPHDGALSAASLAALARGMIIFVAALLALLYSVVFFPDRVIALFGLTTRRLAPAIERRGTAALAAFAEGLGVLRHPARFAAVFAWSLAHWIVQTASIWIGFRAMNIKVPASAALLLNGISSFASAIPSAPGFFGSFEATSILSLRVYGVPDTLAKSWAIGYHVLTFIPITVIGAVYAARMGFSLRDMAGTAKTDT